MYYGFSVFIKNKNDNLIAVDFLFSVLNDESYVKPDNFGEIKKSPGYTSCKVSLRNYDKEMIRYAVMSPDDDHLTTRQGISRAFNRVLEDLHKFLPLENVLLFDEGELHPQLETIREAYRDFVTSIPEDETPLSFF